MKHDDDATTENCPVDLDCAVGHGLGLPLAKEIVTRHGGTITAASASTGTTITVRLPLA